MNSRNSYGRERLLAFFRSRVVKFIAAGVVNTGATYTLYLLLLFYWNYRISYAVSNAAGIVLAFVLNSRLVFRVKLNVFRMATYPFIYLLQYLANAWLINLLVDRLDIAKQIAPLFAICLTLPVVYLLNKLVLTQKSGLAPLDRPAFSKVDSILEAVSAQGTEVTHEIAARGEETT